MGKKDSPVWANAEELNFHILKHELLLPEEEQERMEDIQNKRVSFLRSSTNQFILEGLQERLATAEPHTHEWQNLFRSNNLRSDFLDSLETQLPQYTSRIARHINSSRKLLAACIPQYPTAPDIPEKARDAQKKAAEIITTLQPKTQHVRNLMQELSRYMSNLMQQKDSMLTRKKGDPRRHRWATDLTKGGETIRSFPITMQTMEDRFGSYHSAVGEFSLYYHRLVSSVAKKFKKSGIAFPQLFQSGITGLMHAVEKFAPQEDLRFSTYATWWIKQSIHTEVRNNRSFLKLPTNSEIHNTILSARHSLYREFGYEPDAEEIAMETGLPEEEIHYLLNAQRVRSLHQIIKSQDNDHSLEIFMGKEDRAIEHFINNDQITMLLDNLQSRERDILKLYFGLDGNEMHTLEEIGQELGIVKERVRQLKVRALQQLLAIIKRSSPSSSSPADPIAR